MVENIKEVMQFYSVYPIAITKITDRLYRIKDEKGEYALKRSSLTVDHIAAWERVYYMANEKNLSAIVPVYLTQEGKLYQEKDEAFYYLTPWLEITNRSSQKWVIEQTMQSLAHLHESTKQVLNISSDKLKKSFRTYQEQCKDLPNELQSYVIQFEKNTYMSPFELLVCTHYREIEQAFNWSNTRINEFLDQPDEEITWNNSLCHGHLTPEHVVNSYFINWEKAEFDHGVRDLTNYISQLTGNFDQSRETITTAFQKYKAKNNLTESELKLLTVYLLNPSPYITAIRNYVGGKSKESMVHQVCELQQDYRKLIFALQFTEFIKDEYETISFEDPID